MPEIQKVKQSHYRPGRFQEVEAPRFQDSWHMKVVRLSALRTSRSYRQETFLVLISVKRLSQPQGQKDYFSDTIGNRTCDLSCSAVLQICCSELLQLLLQGGQIWNHCHRPLITVHEIFVCTIRHSGFGPMAYCL
jgi:hypothetical protein